MLAQNDKKNGIKNPLSHHCFSLQRDPFLLMFLSMIMLLIFSSSWTISLNSSDKSNQIVIALSGCLTLILFFALRESQADMIVCTIFILSDNSSLIRFLAKFGKSFKCTELVIM